MESYKRNRYTFGLGTIGRDMVYSMVSMYLVFYLTDVLNLSDSTMWWITGIILAARVFDALNDPIMGTIVDNTRTKFGKHKPWIAFGAITSAVLTILLFCDLSLEGAAFTVVFGIIYVFWGMAFTTNDIAYWSLLPELSMEQKERERMGAFARICANIGLFAVAGGIVPITEALSNALGGDMKQAYLVFALICVGTMLICQCITVFGVKEPKLVLKDVGKTTLKDMVKVIFKNDQLLFTALSMALFTIGYDTTTSFGQYFFKYAYGDVNMYSIFAIVLGVSQIAALAVFPLFSKRFDRKKLYAGATVLVFLGYAFFFFAPTNTMLFISIAGVLLFVGQAFIQLLMLMFLADSIEYGQWKLGKRNDSVSFAIQPFINKMGGAVGSAIVSATVIIAGINKAESAAEVTAGGLLTMKFSMLVLPLIFIIVGFIIYLKKYKIDSNMYERILSDLRERGEIASLADTADKK